MSLKNKSIKIRPSMKKDFVHPKDFNKYKIPFSCEDCSHFKSENETCTLGFKTEPHLKRNVIKIYNLCGKIPQCRFLEID